MRLVWLFEYINKFIYLLFSSNKLWVFLCNQTEMLINEGRAPHEVFLKNTRCSFSKLIQLQTFEKCDLATRIKRTAFLIIVYFLRIDFKMSFLFYSETYSQVFLMEMFLKIGITYKYFDFSLFIKGFPLRILAAQMSAMKPASYKKEHLLVKFVLPNSIIYCIFP